MNNPRIKDARSFLTSLLENPFKLPFDSSLVPTLFRYTSESSRATMKEIAELISRSQDLAEKLISLANSACYNLLTPVSVLERAVGVMGILDLRTAVLMYGINSAIPPRGLPKTFPADQLWAHGLRTAKLGRLICRLIASEDPGAPDLPEPECVYSAGVIHDLGKFMLACRRPDDWRYVNNANNYRGMPFAEAEEAYWGLDHGAIGGILLRDWNLPANISYMVSWHHHWTEAQDHRLAVRILAAANLLAQVNLHPVDRLSKEQIWLKQKGFPDAFVDILPEYVGLMGAHYEKFVAIKKDRHTSAFVNAA